MKRFGVLVLGGLLFVTAPLAAQSSPSIGFKVGATFSNLSVGGDDEGVETNQLTSFGGGGFLRFGMGGLALQIDVLALTKGSELSDPGDDDFDLKLDYIEVPVQLVFSLGTGRLSPYAMVGPSFAFEIGCNIEGDDGAGGEVEADCQEGDVFARKSFDLGLTGAAGLQIPMGPGSVILEGRYTHGLSNIWDDQDTSGEFTVRNRSWGIFAGYTIPIGR